jgi:hypothetical protein
VIRAVAFFEEDATVSFMVGCMPLIQDGPGAGSAKGWQGDDLDTEIESVAYNGKARYRWTIYDRAHVVETGLSRTRAGANIACVFYGWRYRQTL